MSSDLTRFKLLVIAIFLTAVLICMRLIYLQVISGDFYTDISNEQIKESVKLTRDRGVIYDSHGMPLAANKIVASMYIAGRDIDDPKEFLSALQKEGMKLKSSVRRRIMAKEKFIWIKRNMEVPRAEYLRKRIAGLHYTKNENRLYPQKKIAASIIGFSGVDNQGLSGMEHRFDRELKGKAVKVTGYRDRKGNIILFESSNFKLKPKTSVHLSIDAKIQGMAEYILDQGIKKFEAKRAIAIAMDIETGKIVFSANSGGFDPNRFSKYSKREWKNYGSTYLFEPGSIFKPVMFGYLIENENLNINKKYYCGNGHYNYKGFDFKDVSKHGTLKAKEVIIHSSNIGIIKMSNNVDNKGYYEYLKNLGFGDKTGVFGVSEEKGILRDYTEWSILSRPSLSMGQEIMVTPLQMVRYYAAIANGGYLLKPSFIDRIERNGMPEYFEPEKEIVMSEHTALIIRKTLRETVIRGTGFRAESKYVQIAGKTGTGQKFNLDTGKYSKKNYIASFAGFFPANKPKIAMVVVYDSPRKSIYGGTTSALTFKKLAELLTIYQGYERKWVHESKTAS